MADLDAKDHEITVKILWHHTRQGQHEYLIELFEGEQMIIGNVLVESPVELETQAVFDRAVKQYYLPIIEAA